VPRGFLLGISKTFKHNMDEVGHVPSIGIPQHGSNQLTKDLH
jgi:hypothetical protein